MEHSRNMAEGTVPFSHDGFFERCEKFLKFGGGQMAENVAMNRGSGSPAKV